MLFNQKSLGVPQMKCETKKDMHHIKLDTKYDDG